MSSIFAGPRQHRNLHVITGRILAFSLICAALLPSPAAQAGEVLAPIDAPSVSIAGSTEHLLISPETGEHLRVLVWQPKGPIPDGGFPVLYTFDGSWSLGMFADLAGNLGGAARRFGKKPAMVVGIGYVEGEGGMRRRTYDLTPLSDDPEGKFHMPERPNGQPWDKLGGGDAFLDRIEREVKPLVNAHYPVDQGRETLYGHSLGGLMTLHAAFTRPGSFDKYVASSPSLWVNNGQGMREAEAFLARPSKADEAPLRLMMSVGGEEEALNAWERTMPKGRELRAKWKAENRMVQQARALAALIETRGKGRVSLDFKVFDGEDHMSARPISAYRAIRFAIED